MNNWKVHLALFSVALFYAIFFSWAGEIMPKYLKPEGFILMRIGISAILYQIIYILFIQKQSIEKRDYSLFFICALFGVAANMTMFFKGLSLTKPINGAVLMMVTPLFVAIFEHLQKKQRPAFLTISGFILGTLGAVMLIATKGASFTKETLMGDIWIALNAASYAIYLVKVKKLLTKYHAVNVNRITFSIGVILVLPLGIIPLSQANFGVIPQEIWAKIGYTLIITTFVVYQLNAYAVKFASSSLAGTYIYLQPILATIIAILLRRDELTLSKVIWGTTIFIGVFMVLHQGQKNKKLIMNGSQANLEP